MIGLLTQLSLCLQYAGNRKSISLGQFLFHVVQNDLDFAAK